MAANRVNPKRAGNDYLQRADLNESEPSSKKPRFDYRNPSTLAPDADDAADAVLDLDEIGKKGQQSKRKAVKLDGYESDSSNENFDSRAAEKAREKRREEKSKDEDDNDMFADLEEEDGDDDEELAREGKKPKKEVRFIDENDIEGQVKSSKAGGHVSADFSLDDRMEGEDKVESSSDDSGGEEERARVGDDADERELGAGAKRHHAPKLDAFNMANEAEEGKFDAHGNFVRKAADPFAVHDSWLEGSSKADIKRAKEAHEKREEQRRKQDLEDDAIETSQLLDTLISWLEKDETPLEALARFGSSKEKRKKKTNFQRNKGKNATEMDVDADSTGPSPAEVRRKEAVEAITGAADKLMTRGQEDIYDTERAMLIRHYKRETGEDWSGKTQLEGPQDDSENKQWEFRWSDTRDGGEIHGPYDGSTMDAWKTAGYFGEGVEFRRVGTDNWTRALRFVEST